VTGANVDFEIPDRWLNGGWPLPAARVKFSSSAAARKYRTRRSLS
jgi:hypothetical protein